MASVTQIQVPNKVTRAAIYLRVSSSAQEQEGTSLGTQEDRCRRYAADHGYVIDEGQIYREVHTGVELWERPQLTRLREAVRRREIDVVIAYAIDRLSRDPVHLGVIISEADHAGVGVEFVSEPLDNSSEGQLIRFVRGYAAKVEHEKIKERMMRGRLARAQSGQYIPGNRVRYGYRWRDEKKTGLDIDQVTGPVVRRMFTEVAAGSTLRQVAAGLTADGIPTPTNTGNGWRKSSILQIVSDEIYSGRASAFRRAYVTTPDGRATRKWRFGSERKVDLPVGTAPAIVEAETFELVRERLIRNQKEAIRNARHPEDTLLRAGYVFCGYCGRSMSVRRGGHSGEYLQYWCKNLDDGFWRCDGRATIAANMLDKAVWERVEAVLLQPNLIAAELQRQLGTDPVVEDLDALKRRTTEVERRQRNLVNNLALVEGDAAQMIAQQLAELGRQRTALELERLSVLARRQSWELAKERLTELEVWRRKVAANLKSLTYGDKRLALDALGVHVKVWRVQHDPHYEVTANIPLEIDIASTSTHKCGGLCS